MAIDSAQSILPKNTTRGFHWGKNTKRAIAKPFIATTKGAGKGFMAGGGNVVSYGLGVDMEGDFGLVAILGAAAVTTPIGAIYGVGHGCAGLVNSARKGVMNRMGLR
jgi:hypothetical protein